MGSEHRKELPIMWKGEFLNEIKGEFLEALSHEFPPMYSIPLNLINIGSTPALNELIPKLKIYFSNSRF
jgi:hypothetical protein